MASPLSLLLLSSPSSLSFTVRSSTSDSNSTSSDEPPPSDPDADPFESRLSQIRRRYRSGTGKKAEIRKIRKGKRSESGSGSSGVFLPPVPLKEAKSGGLKVEFGFSRYAEKVNGRLAAIGLAAVVAVEVATGKGVLKYHSPAVVFVQVYFMAAVSAVYLKSEKEKVSVWPGSAPPLSSSSSSVEESSSRLN